MCVMYDATRCVHTQAENSVTVTFMKAVLALQQGEFGASEVYIARTRMLLGSKVSDRPVLLG